MGLPPFTQNRVRVGAVVALAIVLAAVAAGVALPDGRPPLRSVLAAGAGFTHPSRVAVLVLENRSYGQVVGNRNAPYLNRLAARNALATRYYAVAHPSLPNYIALTSGSTAGITRDCTSCDVRAPNLVNQLDRAGISWKAYFEGLTSSNRPGRVTRTYNPHYNPFVYFDAVRGRPADRSRIVGFADLQRDLDQRRLPRFTWIAPSVRHDGHNGSLRETDSYAARLVPRLLRALGRDGVLYVTWDEGARGDKAGLGGSAGGGRIALIAAGGAARHGTTTAVPADHFALLRTIEGNFGLRTLGQAGAPSTPLLSGLLQPAGWAGTARAPGRVADPSDARPIRPQSQR
jgi:hypothetical protein